jgi:hypothetical protein
MEAGWSTTISTIPCLACSLSNSSAASVRCWQRLVEHLLSAVDGGGVMFALADVQPQIDADVRFTRHDRRSRRRLFPGLTCGIRLPASTLQRHCRTRLRDWRWCL